MFLTNINLFNQLALISVLLLLSTIIPPAPKEIGIFEIVYIITFGLNIYIWLIRRRFLKIPKNTINISLTFLYLLLIESYFVGRLYDVSLEKYIRGIVPFLNSLVFFIVLTELKSPQQISLLINTLRLIALIFPLKAGNDIINSLITEPLISYAKIRASLEGSMFGVYVITLPIFFITLRIFAKDLSSKFDWLIIILSSTTLIITFLRSAILIFTFVLMLLISKAVHEKTINIKKILFIILKIGISLSCLSLTLIFEPVRILLNTALSIVLSGYIDRFKFLLEKGDVRLVETQEVLKHFIESPFLGKGLGFQYSYHRDIYMNKSFFWMGGYTHNIYTYFLLDFGIVGTLILTLLIISIIYEFKKNNKHPSPRIRGLNFSFGLAILTMFLYANFQSIYRSVPYFLLFFTFLGIMVKLRYLKDTHPTGERHDPENSNDNRNTSLLQPPKSLDT